MSGISTTVPRSRRCAGRSNYVRRASTMAAALETADEGAAWRREGNLEGRQRVGAMGVGIPSTVSRPPSPVSPRAAQRVCDGLRCASEERRLMLRSWTLLPPTRAVGAAPASCGPARGDDGRLPALRVGLLALHSAVQTVHTWAADVARDRRPFITFRSAPHQPPADVVPATGDAALRERAARLAPERVRPESGAAAGDGQLRGSEESARGRERAATLCTHSLSPTNAGTAFPRPSSALLHSTPACAPSWASRARAARPPMRRGTSVHGAEPLLSTRSSRTTPQAPAGAVVQGGAQSVIAGIPGPRSRCAAAGAGQIAWPFQS
ncbi:hypothetical protein BU26DRAFT_583732 [Trematosphaeria pertusa]|uniref:Uncharacterized protein n=1 Tax=Trematosphaeria pertusa TaxID=390896 RepID=A0A6A6IXK5_9PLEO|nr:uncharacterized protein BU26DRAFT_583732 [Trematosphaeria pertusa]KAF2255096.1 hypothetical protein BU26DRAFT_583732 [Trematosphaeria pertusa]